MPTCPNCGRQIDYLRDFSLVWVEHKLTVENGGANYEFVDNSFPMDTATDEYECPECHKVLFTDADEAVRFLMDETNE